MLFASVLSVALAAVVTACPTASRPQPGGSAKPPAFFLAGDSTTATYSEGGGGWGDGFIGTLKNGAIGLNFGHNGATTKTFREMGDWAAVLNAVKKNNVKFTPYVTISFGHNDQKNDTTKFVALPLYKINLAHMIKDVRDAGGIAIIVTSLSRRTYNPTTKTVNRNLKEYVAAALDVAKAEKCAFVDLNEAAARYLDAIGEANGNRYNHLTEDLYKPDRTHLNLEGGVLFGNMVASLILNSKVGKNVKSYVIPDPKITAAIGNKIFILPSPPIPSKSRKPPK